jgi:hypothetical protein
MDLAGTLAADKVEAGSYAIKETSELVGSSTLAAGNTQAIIPNINVKENSKIFVTATSSTQGQSLIVSEKIAEQSFTISIDIAISQDITFDWWILDISQEEQIPPQQ